MRNISGIMDNKYIENIIKFVGFMCIIGSFNYINIINYQNISMYILIILVYVLYKYTSKMKIDKIVRVFSIIFSIMITFGYFVNHNLIDKPYILIIQLIGWYSLFTKVFALFEDKLLKIEVVDTTNDKKIKSTKFILVSMVFGFLCFLPYFLLYFPAIMTADSYSQGLQVMGMISYSNHHPWVHTMLIKLFYEIGYFISKNKVIGISFYTVFQLITLCFIYSYAIYILYKNNVKKLFLGLLWIFFFINPFNAIYAVTMWKDILFSGFSLLFVVFLWDHYHNNKKWNIKNKISLTLFFIILSLLRSNGIYALIIFVLVLFIMYREEFKKLLLCIILSFVIIFVVKIPIMNAFNVKQPDFIESLSIPLQQVSYVVKKEHKISDRNMKVLKKFVNVEKLYNDKNNSESYIISDSIKNNIRNTNNEWLEKHKLEFVKLWISLGVKYPAQYIKAYILQTSSYWYYNSNQGYWVYILDVKTDGFGGSLGFERHNYLPNSIAKVVNTVLTKYTDLYYNTWNPAMALYVMLVSLFMFIRKKKNILCLVFPVGVFATLLIATPVACEFRYAYPLYLTFPFLFIVSLIDFKKNRGHKEN